MYLFNVAYYVVCAWVCIGLTKGGTVPEVTSVPPKGSDPSNVTTANNTLKATTTTHESIKHDVTVATNTNGDYASVPKPTVAPKDPDGARTSTTQITTAITQSTTNATSAAPTQPITASTSLAPNTPASTTTTTTIAPSTTTTLISTTSTTPTTAIPTTTSKNLTPTDSSKTNRHFDGPSFIGGIIFALGLMGIGFVAFRFYKARTEQNYHTL